MRYHKIPKFDLTILVGEMFIPVWALESGMTIGLEMEFWVVDEYGHLCDGHDLTEVHDDALPEFVESLIEVQTPPGNSVATIADSLRDVLERLLEEAAETDRRLVPLGTPLSENPSGIPSERGEFLEQIYGDGLEVAKNCAGTHVHFEKGNVARQLNLLTALDPALALACSSPYYKSERLACSSRAYAYRYKAGYKFGKFRVLWEYTDDVAEWESRLQQVYDELRAMALKRDVTPEQFGELFDRENVVVTPVRLRNKTPTVEWRSPDTTLPSQILQLLADLVPLVRLTDDLPVEIGDPGIESDRIGIPEYANLQHLSDAAIERGLNSTSVWKYLEQMNFDTTRYHPISDQIYADETISDERARRVRLEYATLLERDVRGLGR